MSLADDIADITRANNAVYLAGMRASLEQGRMRVPGGNSQPSPSAIQDRDRSTAQRDILMAALAKLSERLHTPVDLVGCAILQRIIEDARYKIAEIELSRPKVG